MMDREKKQFINELSKMPLALIKTAYLYAVKINVYGVDITEKWETAEQNTRALGVAYRKGYYAALQLEKGIVYNGKWIEHFDESGKWYECDRCHTDWGSAVNFCPNCGAKMYK